MKTENKPEFLSMAELIEKTGLSKYRVNKMIKEGLPWYKFGNSKKFKEKVVDEWIEENCRVVERNMKRDFNNLYNETLKKFTN